MKDEKSYELHADWEEGHRIGRLIISHDRRGQMIAFDMRKTGWRSTRALCWTQRCFLFPGGSMQKRVCLAFWKMLHRTDGDGSF